jgi:hypothetical protein
VASLKYATGQSQGEATAQVAYIFIEGVRVGWRGGGSLGVECGFVWAQVVGQDEKKVVHL